MKYKVGDRVRIKSLDWYNENKDENGIVELSTHLFIPEMVEHCGTVVTIKDVFEDIDDNVVYCMEEIDWDWTNEMIEGLVEEEVKKKLSDEKWRYKNIFDPSQYPQSFECPQGYQFKDENGNVIEAKKIVLEKKKKEYPNTYEECYKIMGVKLSDCYIQGYKSPLLEDLQELLICRDAYWKLYGEEMGLGKPWEPNWDAKDNHFYTIHTFNGKIECSATAHRNAVLIFPTQEMRDAFYENFKEEIEICKELL